MARRRRQQPDGFEAVFQITGLALAASLISPQVRALMSTTGFILIATVVIVAVGFLGLRVYKSVNRQREYAGGYGNTTLAVAAPVTEAVSRTDSDIVADLRKMDWYQFERLVAFVYQKLGYHVTRQGGANPDGGIDLVIERDGGRWAVQCKHWKTWNIGVRNIREFLGALTDAGIQAGIFVALGDYTADAKNLAEKHGIQILNESDLAGLIERTNCRFDPEAIAILKDTNPESDGRRRDRKLEDRG